jgi:2-oxoglutarate dehydrogenase E2 component (dihydrolipoamide succinyltransferase)
MAIDIKVPVLPESVSDATIATWHKKPGDPVKRDENLVDIETDKVVLEVVAPADGTLEKILHQTGDTVKGEQVIGLFKAGEITAAPVAVSAPVAAPIATTAPAAAPAGPAVRRMMGENDVAPESVTGTGKSGRVTKDDVTRAMTPAATVSNEMAAMGSRAEKRVPMTRLRARIAERLIQSQQTAAILTTFNEINMKPVMDLRAKYKDAFEKRHGVKLGFMSFFTRAVVEALKRFPIVNSSIDGNDIVYHGYMDIGIAVSSPRGLVVPVIRNTETLSMAEIEQKIAEYGKKAQVGQLGIEDMTGGTFTISNGGTFGSLMSTPIINPPQTGILGMHKIEERPVVENGQIVIRPMMYVAMSYDHRLIDGSESVRFLVTIKEMLEDPARLVLEV